MAAQRQKVDWALTSEIADHVECPARSRDYERVTRYGIARPLQPRSSQHPLCRAKESECLADDCLHGQSDAAAFLASWWTGATERAKVTPATT
jgi:hypothetical protein